MADRSAQRLTTSWHPVVQPGGISAYLDAPTRLPRPLTPATAWERVGDWLATPVTWIPQPGPEHGQILGELFRRHEVRGNLVPDAMLAALAIEHGLTLHSTDTDFALFSELRWTNPLDLAQDTEGAG